MVDSCKADNRPEEEGSQLLSGRLLARNTLWNFGGMAVPMLVGLFAIPILVTGMGKERFGLLGIVWMAVGYFSLFDMGLGAALTQLVATRLGKKQTADFPEIVWTALWLIAGFGLVGSMVVALLAEPLIVHILKVPANLENEGVVSIRLMAVSIPVVIATSALSGLLEARQRFATVAKMRVPLGIMTFLGPVISLQFSPSLIGATAILVATRIVAFLFYYICAARLYPFLKHPARIVRTHIRPLFNFGSWLTVSNIVGPLMTYVDRFLIGALLSMTAVAYYVTPYDIMSRIQMLPQAVMGVIFPALAMAAAGDRARLPKMYGRTTHIIFWLLLPVTSCIFFVGPEALQLWLGTDFRLAATPVVRWLALGWTINVLARSPFTVLQSVGRPDLVAKTHLAELIPYLAALWYLTLHFGIAGTAAAWTLRVLTDAIVLNELVRRKLSDLSAVIRWSYAAIVCLLAGALLALLIEPLIWRGIALLSIASVAGVRLLPLVKSWRNADRDGCKRRGV